MLITHRLINKDNERYLSLYVGEQNLLIAVEEIEGNVRATRDRLCFNPSDDNWCLVPLTEEDDTWRSFLTRNNTSAMIMAMITYEVCNTLWQRHELSCVPVHCMAAMSSIQIAREVGGEPVARLQIIKRNGELTANVKPMIDVPSDRDDVVYVASVVAKVPSDIILIASAMSFWYEYEWLDDMFPYLDTLADFPKRVEATNEATDEADTSNEPTSQNEAVEGENWLKNELCQFRLAALNPPIDAPLSGIGTEFREEQHNDGTFTFTIGYAKVKWNSVKNALDNDFIGDDIVTRRMLGEHCTPIYNRLMLGEQLIMQRLKVLLDEADTTFRYTYVPETCSLVAYPMYNRDSGKPFYHLLTHWYTRYEFCIVCVGMWTDTETFNTEIVHITRIPSPVFMVGHMKLLGNYDV